MTEKSNNGGITYSVWVAGPGGKIFNLENVDLHTFAVNAEYTTNFHKDIDIVDSGAKIRLGHNSIPCEKFIKKCQS